MKKLNQSGMAHAAILLVFVVAALGGVGYYVYAQNHDNTTKSNETEVQTLDEDLPVVLPADLLSIDKIQELSNAKKPDTQITGIELESENGQLIYLVRLSDGTNLLLDAKTGDTVTGIKVEKDDDKTDDLPKSFNSTITISKAFEIAKNKNPNGTIKQIELEVEDGKVVFSIKFTDGTKVIVDAESGNIVKIKTSESKNSSDSSNESKSENSQDDNDDLSEDSSSSHNKGTSNDENDGSESESESDSSSNHSGSDSSNSGSNSTDD